VSTGCTLKRKILQQISEKTWALLVPWKPPKNMNRKCSTLNAIDLVKAIADAKMQVPG